jgi:hypothetical protein
VCVVCPLQVVGNDTKKRNRVVELLKMSSVNFYAGAQELKKARAAFKDEEVIPPSRP